MSRLETSLAIGLLENLTDFNQPRNDEHSNHDTFHQFSPIFATLEEGGVCRTTSTLLDVLGCVFKGLVDCIHAASHAEDEMGHEHSEINSDKSKLPADGTNQTRGGKNQLRSKLIPKDNAPENRKDGQCDIDNNLNDGRGFAAL